MEKRFEVNWLYDFYGPLLTEHRRELLRLYCEEDMSLGEIASSLGVTRQAIYDSVKAASDKLEQYEEKLGMLKRYVLIKARLSECKSLLSSARESDDSIEKALAAIEEIERIVR